MQGGIRLEPAPRPTLRSARSGSDPARARHKAVQRARNRIRFLLPRKEQRFAAGAASAHSKRVSLPSLPLTLFTSLQIVSTFRTNIPRASAGEGASAGVRGEGPGRSQMGLFLLKKKVEYARSRLEPEPGPGSPSAELPSSLRSDLEEDE